MVAEAITTTSHAATDGARPDEEGLVIVADDMPDVRQMVASALSREGYVAEEAPSGEACLSALGRLLPDAIFLDLDMPGLGGLDTLERIQARNPRLPVIVLTADSNTETVVQSMRLGAFDYLVKPVGARKLVTVARNAIDKHRMSLRLASLEREALGQGYPEIVGQSPAMKKMFRQMDRLSNTDITLLVHGESGTGKELVARAIHAHSARKRGPFIAVNCAAIPETLHESELFGHERGAFTGATNSRIGKFELAHRGTLFLDEVGELSLSLQAKLLRVLQEPSFHRVGGSREIRSDFRLVAATHRDLLERVREGKFREDLYFRIVVYELGLPPLRERVGDVEQLAREFLDELSRSQERPAEISKEAMALLQAYPWPGNVRELKNVIQRAVVFMEAGVVLPEHLPPRLREAAAPWQQKSGLVETNRADAPKARTIVLNESEDLNLERLERKAIERALKLSNGNVTEVGRLLGVSRATLYRKIRKYGLR